MSARRSAVLCVAVGCAVLGASGGLRLAGAGAEEGDDAPFGVLLEEGERHYGERRYSEAIRAFEGALEKAPAGDREHVERTLARVRSALGMELLGGGETRAAAREFERALDLAEDFYALFGLGYLASVRLENATAEQLIARALELESGYARAHVLFALLAYRAGRVDEALDRLDTALELDPEDREAQALRDRWKRALARADRLAERRSGRFLVRSDPALPAGTVRRVVKLLRESHDELAEALATWSTRPVVVVLLAAADFHEATGSRHFVGGTYDGQLKLPVPADAAVAPARWQELAAAVRHELTHVLVRQVLPECPGWLNEGIAQHFEHRAPAARLAAEVAARLASGGTERMRFADLPARLWEVASEELARRIYLQSLGFTEYLVAQHHEFRLRLLLGAARNEGSLARAFRRTYSASLEELEARWWGTVAAASRSGPDAAPALAPTPRAPRRPRPEDG